MAGRLIPGLFWCPAPPLQLRDDPSATDAGGGASVNSNGAGGGAGAGTGDGSDDDNDPELQELYVQAYACRIFSDDAAARAVEDGVHLRPLVLAQVGGRDTQTRNHDKFRKVHQIRLAFSRAGGHG